MRGSMKVAAVAVIGALALQPTAFAAIPDSSGSAAEGAAAGGTEWASSVKQTEYGNGKFKGKVTSAFALEEHHTTDVVGVCVANRDIELYRTFTKKTKNGKRTVTAKVGTATTNDAGAFAVELDKKSGSYKAVALKTEVAYFDYYGDTGEEMVAVCLGAKGSY